MSYCLPSGKPEWKVFINTQYFMNKILLLAGMLAAFTACQKDEGLVSGGATSQTITVTIPQGCRPVPQRQTSATGRKSTVVCSRSTARDDSDKV